MMAIARENWPAAASRSPRSLRMVRVEVRVRVRVRVRARVRVSGC